MKFKKLVRILACRPIKEEEQDVENGLRKSDSLLEKSPDKENTPKATKKSNKKSSSNNNSEDNNHDNENSRYMLELQERNFYTIREVNNNNKYLDISRSFAPKPKWWMIISKLIIFAWIAYIFVTELFKTYPKSAFLVTFDHWALIITMIYLWFSFICNILFHNKPSSSSSSSNRYIPTTWHKVTWTLFSIAAPSELFASLAYWLSDDHEQGIDLIVHGSVVILLLVEGLCLNRIPVRINHQFFFFGFMYLFLLWSLIHSYTNIGNPMKSRGNDDLYSFLQWNTEPWFTVLNVILILFFVVPFVYSIIWLLSLFSFPWNFDGENRRYLNRAERKPLKKQVENEGL